MSRKERKAKRKSEWKKKKAEEEMERKREEKGKSESGEKREAEEKGEKEKGETEKGETGKGEKEKSQNKRGISSSGLTPDPKRGKGEHDKRVADPSEGETAKKRPRTSGGVTWADVARRGVAPCRIVSADNAVALDHADFMHINSQVMDMTFKMSDEDAMLCVPVKAGIQDGMVALALASDKGVALVRDCVPGIAPRKEGGPGYKFYGPGELPYVYFLARTSDVRSGKEWERFEKACLRYMPGLRGGLFRVVRRIFPREITEEAKSVGLLLRVGEEILPVLEQAGFRIPFGFATVDLERYGTGSGTGKEPEEEDEDVVME